MFHRGHEHAETLAKTIWIRTWGTLCAYSWLHTMLSAVFCEAENQRHEFMRVYIMNPHLPCVSALATLDTAVPMAAATSGGRLDT